ncbi:hypothetical protein CspHIS471_0100220 [Cutaneotrichosporon sp. HIS471]|nr:hypothetical protein CspHIS471_0100220 [Cutaneotrichosporon sp. HIS471]
MVSMASNSPARDAFWRSIDTAWERVDKRDSLLALLEAETPSEIIDAAAALTRLLPSMLTILENTLETYTSPQLWSWSVECKKAVDELLRTEVINIVSADCQYQESLNAAWVIAMGEQVSAAAKIFCEDWISLRGRIVCDGLLRLAWRMHFLKFPTTVTQAAARALQARIEASRMSDDQTSLESPDGDSPLGESGTPGQINPFGFDSPPPPPAVDNFLGNDRQNGDHKPRNSTEGLPAPVTKPPRPLWKLW